VVEAKPAYNFDYIRTVVNLDDETAKEDYGEKKKADRPGGATGMKRNSQFQDPRLPVPR
jgi:hypothetical protein